MKSKYNVGRIHGQLQTSMENSRPDPSLHDCEGCYTNSALELNEVGEDQNPRVPGPRDAPTEPNSYARLTSLPNDGTQGDVNSTSKICDKNLFPIFNQHSKKVSFDKTNSQVHINEVRKKDKSPNIEEQCNCRRDGSKSTAVNQNEEVLEMNTCCCAQLWPTKNILPTISTRFCKLASIAATLVLLILLGLVCYSRRESIQSFFLKNDIIVCETPECVVAAGEILSSLDVSVSPCLDFYSFACGGWKKKHPIPPTFRFWDSFSVITEELHHNIKGLLTKDPTKKEPKTIASARKFYKACVNDEKLNEKGTSPLLHLLNEFGGMPALSNNWNASKFDWLETLAKLRREIGLRSIISVLVRPDDKNTTSFAIYLNRGYVAPLISDVAKNDSKAKQWQMAQMLTTIGSLLSPKNDYDSNTFLTPGIIMNNYTAGIEEETPRLTTDHIQEKLNIFSEVQDVWNFIVKLAKIMDVDQHIKDANLLYNPMTVRELTNIHGDEKLVKINYLKYLKSIFASVEVVITEETRIIVQDINFFKQLPHIMQETPVRIIGK